MAHILKPDPLFPGRYICSCGERMGEESPGEDYAEHKTKMETGK